MAYNATRKVRTKDLKSLAEKLENFLGLSQWAGTSSNRYYAITPYTGSGTIKKTNITEVLDVLNLQLVSLYDFCNNADSDLAGEIGSLSDLTTSDKTSLVNAVNAVKSLADAAQTTANTGVENAAIAQTGVNTVNGFIGTLSSLNTSAKGNLVAAINELNARTAFINDAENANALSRAGFHNSIFRGKNLGTSITAAQWTAIRNGTFDDMFVGDYWTLGGQDYFIAHFDYYFNIPTLKTVGFEDSNGDVLPTSSVHTQPASWGFSPHHIVIMPRTRLALSFMNTEDTKDQLYGTCHYRLNKRKEFITTMSNYVGAEHLMYWIDIFPRSISTNSYGVVYPSGDAEYVCQAELPNFIQLTGYRPTSYSRLINNEGRVPGQFAAMRHSNYHIRPSEPTGGASYATSDNFFTRDIIGLPGQNVSNSDNQSVIFGAWHAHTVVSYVSPQSNRSLRPYFCLMG